MKGLSFEQFMLRAWYERHRWLVLLRPLSMLYRHLACRRRQRFLQDQTRVWQPPVPLIVVGNITLGGTGKTPMCIWLVEFLKEQGLRPGVVSRGYGAAPSSLPWLLDPARDDAAAVGDEPLLIARHCQVPVVIDPDRPRAARHLLANAEVDVILSDDGLQHYRLGRHLEIVMLDAARGLGNGRCLPEGPLREPPERLESVDLVVRNGAEGDNPEGYAMTLAPVALVNLRSGERVLPAQWQGDRRVAAIAGIGNPERFFLSLEQLSFDVQRHAFSDHARYSLDSFADCDPQRPLLMTEKDAVKCKDFALPNWWYLSVDASLSHAFAAALEQRLASLSPTPA